MAGVAWHIIQRGNNRSACFYAEDDYRFYLETLKEQAEKQGCAVHAYVLMTNHVHLLVTPASAGGVAAMMKNLGQRYVQYINRTYRRSGTLWEGRYKSCLAQSEDYVLACYRYIELNPVRANMVACPGHYRWSSFAANGYGKDDGLITRHEQYLRLGRSVDQRLENYRALFSAHLDADVVEQIGKSTNGNFVLGEGRFAEQVEQVLKRRVQPLKRGRPAAK